MSDSSETLRRLAEGFPKEWKAGVFEGSGGQSWIWLDGARDGLSLMLALKDDIEDADATMFMLDYLESLGYVEHAFEKSKKGHKLLIGDATHVKEIFSEGRTRSECVALALISTVKEGKP